METLGLREDVDSVLCLFLIIPCCGTLLSTITELLLLLLLLLLLVCASLSSEMWSGGKNGIGRGESIPLCSNSPIVTLAVSDIFLSSHISAESGSERMRSRYSWVKSRLLSNEGDLRRAFSPKVESIRKSGQKSCSEDDLAQKDSGTSPSDEDEDEEEDDDGVPTLWG